MTKSQNTKNEQQKDLCITSEQLTEQWKKGDPPYEGTNNYDKTDFNHAEFYDWVASRPYKVYFSCYDISDKRFYTVRSES